MCSAAAHDPLKRPDHGEAGHLPVLLDEVLNAFAPLNGGTMLDATFGGGGHSRELLKAHAELAILALDCDPAAAPRAKALTADFPGRLHFHPLNFDQLNLLPDKDFAAALFDFGVSSFQLDTADRGFSFRNDAPADMRLDPTTGLSAAEFLETASRDDLVRAIRDYGEEPRWRRVVEAIVDARGSGTLQRTKSLAALIEQAAGPGKRRFSGPSLHPATKSFQGIRIAVNDELGVIERALPVAFKKLRPSGILAAISFHSLEDRIVKRLFNRLAGRPEHGHDHTPQDERTALGELITRKPITPTEAEQQRNPRSRSARLRLIRKF